MTSSIDNLFCHELVTLQTHHMIQVMNQVVCFVMLMTIQTHHNEPNNIMLLIHLPFWSLQPLVVSSKH
jgi:hypothetical protein